HVLRHPFTIGIRGGVLEIALKQLEDAVEAKALSRAERLGTRLAIVNFRTAVRGRVTVQQKILDARGELLKRSLQVEAVGISGELQSAFEEGAARAGAEATIEKRTRPIDDNLRGIEIVL